MTSTTPQLLHPGDLLPYPCRTPPELGCLDTGYYSGSDSLSPASSVESFSSSPPCLRWVAEQEAAARLGFSGPQTPAPDKKRSRSKYPGKKRQSASEREKLRMRGLTRALHHLRTYLPPSVAPPGQTLTKIETLRLAIRYIGQLSAQLGLGEEARHGAAEADGSASPPPADTQAWCRYSCQLSSVTEHWGPEGTRGRSRCREPGRTDAPGSADVPDWQVRKFTTVHCSFMVSSQEQESAGQQIQERHVGSHPGHPATGLYRWKDVLETCKRA
ncbi:hypothetical protein Z043-113694 [Arapaima gigas]